MALTQTTGSGPFGTVTYEDVLAAVEKLKALPKNDKWIVIDPNGNAFTGTINEITAVVLRDHPLLKQPTLKEMLRCP